MMAAPSLRARPGSYSIAPFHLCRPLAAGSCLDGPAFRKIGVNRPRLFAVGELPPELTQRRFRQDEPLCSFMAARTFVREYLVRESPCPYLIATWKSCCVPLSASSTHRCRIDGCVALRLQRCPGDPLRKAQCSGLQDSSGSLCSNARRRQLSGASSEVFFKPRTSSIPTATVSQLGCSNRRNPVRGSPCMSSQCTKANFAR